MKLHPNLVRAVVATLTEIFQNQRYADKAVNHRLRSNPKWGARDRAYIAETIYEIVRWYRLYAHVRGAEPQTDADWYEIVAIHHLMRQEPLPSWDEFAAVSPDRVANRAQAVEDFAVTESIPEWLDRLGRTEMEHQWEETIRALNRRAPIVLRTNTLKTTRKALRARLAREGIETKPFGRDALVLNRYANVFGLDVFRQGWFEVQDAASQEVAEFVDARPGMRIVDTCAGAGGKSLHLAAKMKNKGQIIATDIHDYKLNELRKRARRAGVHNIVVRLLTGAKVYKRLYDTADRVLIDAPCSGTGVLRRNPDTKWKLQPKRLDELLGIQADILDKYSPITKKGGLLIYVTCSVLPSENERQIAAFLERQPGYELIDQKTLLPQDFGFDGFFMAKLRRK